MNCYGGLPSCDCGSLVSTPDIYSKSINGPQKQWIWRPTVSGQKYWINTWIDKLFDLLQIFSTDFQCLTALLFALTRGRILGRKLGQSLKSFPLCCSQSPLVAGFTPCTPLSKSGLKVCNVKIYDTETSSLRTLKIPPRNPNEIVRSWIRLQELFCRTTSLAMPDLWLLLGEWNVVRIMKLEEWMMV